MFVQSFKMAWAAIVANKMRAFLTMLGIIIGVVALIVLVSMVSSATNTITTEVESLGNNMLMVSVLDDKENPLDLSDIEEISELEYINEAAPVAQSSFSSRNGMTQEFLTVYGTTPSYFNINSMSALTGRTLRSADIENSSYVAVLSNSCAEDLFGSVDIIGESFYVGGKKFTVVGVLSEDASLLSSVMGADVIIPYTVFKRMSEASTGIRSFYCSAENTDYMREAERSLHTYLYSRLKQDDYAFFITNMSSVSSVMDRITNLMSLLLGGIAAISLLVGGIGIMNIMLVSVTERTREIGIRKAIGAVKGDIMLQFLIEAMMLSLMGCLIGVAISWLLLTVISAIAGDSVNITMSPAVVFISIAFASATGIAFGLYPANKAANMPPIQALRYEG